MMMDEIVCDSKPPHYFLLHDTANNHCDVFTHDYNYGDVEALIWDWYEGDFSCDCNRRHFLYGYSEDHKCNPRYKEVYTSSLNLSHGSHFGGPEVVLCGIFNKDAKFIPANLMADPVSFKECSPSWISSAYRLIRNERFFHKLPENIAYALQKASQDEEVVDLSVQYHHKPADPLTEVHEQIIASATGYCIAFDKTVSVTHSFDASMIIESKFPRGFMRGAMERELREVLLERAKLQEKFCVGLKVDEALSTK